MNRAQAATQLCLPQPDAAVPFVPAAAGVAAVKCEEDELYRCADGAISDCNAHSVIALCPRGCFAEIASIDGTSPEPGPNVTEDSSIGREAAFAILCSR
jgi:hypothetical protein